MSLAPSDLAHVLEPARGRTAAAVALVLRPSRHDNLELLFIRRVSRHGDRWSGDVAFPGGMARPGEDCVSAAAREAREEVGIVLGAPLGCLRDRITARPARAWPMRVRPVLFALESGVDVSPDPREVDEAFWVPLHRLREVPIVPVRRRVGRLVLLVPAIDLDGRILWGLTLAMVRELRERLARTAPAASGRLS